MTVSIMTGKDSQSIELPEVKYFCCVVYPSTLNIVHGCCDCHGEKKRAPLTARVDSANDSLTYADALRLTVTIEQHLQALASHTNYNNPLFTELHRPHIRVVFLPIRPAIVCRLRRHHVQGQPSDWGWHPTLRTLRSLTTRCGRTMRTITRMGLSIKMTILH